MLLEKAYNVHDEILTRRNKVDIYLHRNSDCFIVVKNALDFVKAIVEKDSPKDGRKFILIKGFELFEKRSISEGYAEQFCLIDKPFIFSEILNCLE